MESITPALDPLGRGALKAWLMTNCDCIIPDLLPFTARPHAEVSPALSPSAANTSTLKQCQGGKPPGREGKFPQFLDQGHHLLANDNISIFCLLQAGTCVSCLEEEKGSSGFSCLTALFYTSHEALWQNIKDLYLYLIKAQENARSSWPGAFKILN